MGNIYMKYTELRDLKNVTNGHVARRTNIPNACFDDWKKGKTKPSMKNLIKLAKYFGVTVDYFLEEEDNDRTT